MAKTNIEVPLGIPKRVHVHRGNSTVVCEYDGRCPITGDFSYRGHRQDNSLFFAIIPHPRAYENQRRWLARGS